jgi:hypothetical protein
MNSIRKLLKTFYGYFLLGTYKDKTAFFIVLILEKAVFITARPLFPIGKPINPGALLRG